VHLYYNNVVLKHEFPLMNECAVPYKSNRI